MSKPVRVVRVSVKGRVQGVSYRVWAADIARDLGLGGWVRNRGDGTVEALFAGPPQHVETMLERCREGPAAARVTAVEIEEEGGVAPERFAIKPTA